MIKINVMIIIIIIDERLFFRETVVLCQQGSETVKIMILIKQVYKGQISTTKRYRIYMCRSQPFTA